MSEGGSFKRSYQGSEDDSSSNKRAYRGNIDKHRNNRRDYRDSSNRRDYGSNRNSKQHYGSYKGGNPRDDFDRYFDDMGYFPKKLIDSAVSIDKIDRSSFTKWDLKPSRFQKFTGDQVKSLGLFPIPGIVKQKYIDEKIVKSILDNELKRMETLSKEKSVMNPRDSRNSCLLLVNNIDERISVASIAEYFKSFLKSLEIFKEKLSDDNDLNVKFKKIHNNTVLLLEFDSYQYCTTCFSLNGERILVDPNHEFVLALSRPKEYVVPWEDESADDDSDTSANECKYISDSIHKLTINHIPKDITELQLTDQLAKALKIEKNQLQYLNLLYDKDHKSTGVAFLKFKKNNNSSHGENLFKTALHGIPEIEIAGQLLRSFRTCAGFKSNENLNYRGLINRAVVSKGTPSKKRTNVLQLLNLINISELLLSSNSDYKTLKETLESTERDIRKKIKRFQITDSFEIKLPVIEESTFNKRQDLKKHDLLREFGGFGRIFIKFDSNDNCEQCFREFNGIKYFGRVVLVSYFSEEDFNNDIF